MMLSVMKLRLCVMIWLVAGCLAFADTPALAPTTSVSTNLPRTNAPISISPEQLEIARAFYLKRGFRLELVAGESLVSDPVAMAFDENGRLFVLESGGADEAAMGRIRLLTEPDTNGVFHASSVFATNVLSPSALTCYGGGVFVATAGQIIYLKDTSGDGVADARREVFKSFGEETNGSSGKVVISSLEWGLDNRIHATTTGAGGDVISSSSPIQSIVLTNGNFSFDPRTFVLAAESGSAPSGLAFDDSGHKFVSSPVRHLQAVMYDANATRNPWFEMPPVLDDLAVSGPASFIYPADRKNLVAHYPDGAMPMHFSAAKSLVIYRGSAFPPDYSGDAFVLDTVGEVIHHDRLRSNGIGWVASRPDDEQGTEFLAVKDGSFQLRQIVNAPDGTLYLAATARARLTRLARTNSAVASATSASGRIYRIVPATFRQPRLPQLGKATGEQLVLMLRHPNGWWRDAAARLLFERGDRTTIVPLIRLLFDLQSPPLARVQALRALDGFQTTADGKPGKALMEPHVIRALNDPDARVREQGVMLAARFILPGELISDRLWSQLSSMTGDPSLEVRYQLAFLLGQIRQNGRAAALAQIIRNDFNDRWLRAAVLSSANDGASEMFGGLSADANFRNSKNGQEFLRQLLLTVGQEDRRAEVAQVLNALRNIPESQAAFSFAVTFENALQRANQSLSGVDTGGVFNALYIRAENQVLDMSLDDQTRMAALRLLCNVTNVDSRLSGDLVDEWPSLRPTVRAEAMMYLLSRYSHTFALAYSLQTGLLPSTEVTPQQIAFLLNYEDQPVHDSVTAVYGNYKIPSRQGVVNQYRRALQLPGDVGRGRGIFQLRCAACHQSGGEGSAIGLSLLAASHLSKETLLTKIVDPNRAGTWTYPEMEVVTSDYETVMGFIARQSPKSTTLIDPNGVERTVGRANNLLEKSL
ncbi:MAG TPA: PVC-type heme-binding CxxCH protein, partial [Verrucomicrobiae bacterium]|nr:PVC-type heme-binding CxxCH protein [Verrucomicrobiae bacterium]